MLAQVSVGVHPRSKLRGVSDGWVWEERKRENPDDTSSLLRRGWWHRLLRCGGDGELEGIGGSTTLTCS